ncbi:hypothetical protein BC332_25487 [Capsicum chinense]|nr:hypothetical protein BC332_25487 [Capsicum chinense]
MKISQVSITLDNVLVYRFPKTKILSSNWPELVSESGPKWINEEARPGSSSSVSAELYDGRISIRVLNFPNPVSTLNVPCPAESIIPIALFGVDPLCTLILRKALSEPPS